jgi:thiol-disulfide isomerase/thioredoxin
MDTLDAKDSAAPAAPVAPALPPFPARVGMALAEPGRALALADVRGGGVRDAAWLVLLGVLCFRLEDLTRALLGLSHLSAGTVLRQLVTVFSREVQEGVFVVIIAGVAVVLGAGRGRRDPSRDLEVGALAYVPYFTVRGIYRGADILVGPLPFGALELSSGLAMLAAAVWVGLGIRQARRRPLTPPGEMPAMPPPELVHAGLQSRVAASSLAAVLGASLFANAAWVTRHVDAIRPLAHGKEAPAFSLPRIDGKGQGTSGQLTLDSLRVQVVLLDFWATWCQPCVQMMGTLEGLYGDWRGKGVEFVGINSDGSVVDPAEVAGFLRSRPASYPMVIDRDGEVGSRYKVVALPHLVLVGRDGTIRKSFWGVTTHTELSQALAAATAE